MDASSNTKKRKFAAGSVAIRVNLMVVIALFCAVAVVAVTGVSFASGFGAGEQTSTNDAQISQTTFTKSSVSEADVLKQANKRDVTSLYKEISDEEEAARIAAEEAQRAADQACIDRGNANKAAAGNPNDGVDFNIGREEFVKVWGERINNYLAGSPLSGYGETFAEAAFENGIDPRVSPAISNTESTKGAHCFKAFNAWGWMDSSVWGDWTTAINAHIAGWAKGYGYTVTLAGAAAYCPDTYQDWYQRTISQLVLI